MDAEWAEQQATLCEISRTQPEDLTDDEIMLVEALGAETLSEACEWALKCYTIQHFITLKSNLARLANRTERLEGIIRYYEAVTASE